MSDIASPSVPSTPKSITSGLAALRRKALTWLLVDGLSKLLLLLVGLIAFDLLVDWLFRLDVAQRGIMMGLCAIGLCVGLYYWLIRPLVHRPNDDALCLQVEDKHRELSQVMISSLQFSRQKQLDGDGISMEMVAATIEQGAKAASEINFGEALNSSRFRLNSTILAACAILLLLVGVGIGQGVSFLDIWFNRNVLFGEMEWPKDTYLEIQGVREDGTLLLTRGDDHNQVVIVLEKSKVIPEKVSIEFRDGGNRSMEEMTRTGEVDGREFELLFNNVSSTFRFRAIGGRDGRSDWVQVQLVDPPGVEDLELVVIPPPYTKQENYELPAGSGPYNVYAGSGLILKGKSNKSLKEATLSVAGNEWPLEREGEQGFSLTLTPEQLVAGVYQFNFVDVEDLKASRPETFEIRIKADRPPRILARTTGISGMIVPRCRIPLEATATDDFAVNSLKLVYEWRGVQNESIPQSGEISFRGLDGFYGEAEVPLRELIDLEPENIPAGAGFKFALVAIDNDEVSGPNEGRSAEIPLRIVTEEELRTDLLRREKEQRQELERILKTQEDLLIEVTAMLADVKSGQDPLESLAPAMRGELLKVMRSQKVIGTNVAAISSRFESFLEEVINNRIDEETGALRDRLRTKIIFPLSNLDEYEIQDSVRGIELSRRQLDKPQELESALSQTVDVQREIVSQIQEVLEAMVKAEGYQEAVNLLNEIKRAEEEVHRLTKQRREQRIRDLLERGGSDDDSGSDDSDGDDSGSDDSSNDDSSDDGDDEAADSDSDDQ